MKWQISRTKFLQRSGTEMSLPKKWQVSCYFGKSKFPKTCQLGKKLAKKVSLEIPLRPFLTQSDSANRERFSTGFLWSFLSSVESILQFCDLARGCWCEGVLLYGSRKTVGSFVLRAFFASNASFARDEPSSKRVGGVGLSRKQLKPRSWRCTQPRAAKATAGVSVVGKWHR